MATIELRNNNWRVSIRKKGMPNIYKSFKTREEAESYANAVESSIDDLRSEQPTEIPKFPFKIWLDRWRKDIAPHRNGAKKEEYFLKFWEDALGSSIAINITAERIEQEADILLKTVSRSRDKKFLSPETRRKYLLMLSSIYSTAIKNWRWAIYNPLSAVNMKPKEKGITTINNKKNSSEPFIEEFKQNFLSLISKEMKSRGIFQREAAKLCSMSLHTFQYATSMKKNPTIETMLKICNGFGFDLKIEPKNKSI